MKSSAFSFSRAQIWDISALIAASCPSHRPLAPTCEITLRVGIQFSSSSDAGTYSAYASLSFPASTASVLVIKGDSLLPHIPTTTTPRFLKVSIRPITSLFFPE